MTKARPKGRSSSLLRHRLARSSARGGRPAARRMFGTFPEDLDGVRRTLESLDFALPASPGAASSTRRPMGESQADITRLLRDAASGDRRDLDTLMAAIYDDMRRLAASHLQNERNDHTLQPTALVHEAYVKLVDQRVTDWKDRLHFFAVASRIIRRILIDRARARQAEKRGGGVRFDLEDRDVPAPERGIDLIALDEALLDLAELDEQQAKIVELRFFGGCSVQEVADLLNIGPRTVDRDWQAAKAWLFCRLERGGGEPRGA